MGRFKYKVSKYITRKTINFKSWKVDWGNISWRSYFEIEYVNTEKTVEKCYQYLKYCINYIKYTFKSLLE